MGRLFGTDGVRGVAGVDLTAELARDLSAAAVRVLARSDHPRVVVGRDTRPSGSMLESAVVDGLQRAGAEVLLAGIVPTPAVAFLTADIDADLGVMISASHNPAPDNGIKFFAAGGQKLADGDEDAIENALGATTGAPTVASPARLGAEAVQTYVQHLTAGVPHPLDGIRVVVDCANGAAATVAGAVYATAGADVVLINTETDGARINDGCGATHLDAVSRAVLEQSADAGIAHDGDADRCMAVAADGSVVDGDQILAVLAVALHDAGRLAKGTVVSTVMANLGFKHAMHRHGIEVAETPVGDRYVLGRMLADDLNLGGEQSGHLILRDHATTGDGLLTALHLLARMAQTGRALSELSSVMTRLPQVLIGVTVSDKTAAMAAPALRDAIAHAESELAADGRVLVRPSGTEPVIRVMVEAPDETVARRIAEGVAATVSA